MASTSSGSIVRIRGNESSIPGVSSYLARAASLLENPNNPLTERSLAAESISAIMSYISFNEERRREDIENVLIERTSLRNRIAELEETNIELQSGITELAFFKEQTLVEKQIVEYHEYWKNHPSNMQGLDISPLLWLFSLGLGKPLLTFVGSIMCGLAINILFDKPGTMVNELKGHIDRCLQEHPNKIQEAFSFAQEQVRLRIEAQQRLIRDNDWDEVEIDGSVCPDG